MKMCRAPHSRERNRSGGRIVGCEHQNLITVPLLPVIGDGPKVFG
jgi:hypothetical protein